MQCSAVNKHPCSGGRLPLALALPLVALALPLVALTLSLVALALALALQVQCSAVFHPYGQDGNMTVQLQLRLASPHTVVSDPVFWADPNIWS